MAQFINIFPLIFALVLLLNSSTPWWPCSSRRFVSPGHSSNPQWWSILLNFFFPHSCSDFALASSSLCFRSASSFYSSNRWLSFRNHRLSCCTCLTFPSLCPTNISSGLLTPETASLSPPRMQPEPFLRIGWVIG